MKGQNLHIYPGLLLLLIFFLSIGSCREEFEYRNSSGRLEFSKDTVFLDTVFTDIGSSTYSFKVYNRTGDDILIPSVGLAQGTNSNYRLNVDGVAGQVFEDVIILARDSIFVFVETTFDIAPTGQTQFLYTDELLFDSGPSQQSVPLVTLIKDANFLFPGRLPDGSRETIPIGADDAGNPIEVEGFLLREDQLEFTAEKPYVIYGYAKVPEERSMVVSAGVRIHFHENSGLIVSENASLLIQGLPSADSTLLENEVIFEGDRLEPSFSEIASQWGTVWLQPGSRDHEISHLTLRNATVGILIETQSGQSAPELLIENSQIYNNGITNLWSRGAVISGNNLVMGNAGAASLRCEAGGDYVFRHCTIGNFWSAGFRTTPALQISNSGSDNSGQPLNADLVRAQFENCIITGNTARELSLIDNGVDSFNFFFTHCLIQFSDFAGDFADNPLYNFDNPVLYLQPVLNGNPAFFSTARNNFILTGGSEAIDIGDPSIAQLLPLDLNGNDRTPSPDSGAYEYPPE